MTKQNVEIETKEIGVDLCKLAELLLLEGLCLDVSSLIHAGNGCKKDPGETTWQYYFNKLDFPLDEVGSTIPFGACDLVLRFSILIEGGEESVGNNVCDPLNFLEFNIEILGNYLDTSYAIRKMYSSWHLDRNISQEGDGNPKFLHPLYHFTYGGRKMEEQALDFGSALILPSPRLPHPPMDAILGIDFIIKNYLHKDKIKKLIQNPEYNALVKKSQDRLWLPYIKSLYSYWENPQTHNFNAGFDCKSVFPLYS